MITTSKLVLLRDANELEDYICDADSIIYEQNQGREI